MTLLHYIQPQFLTQPQVMLLDCTPHSSTTSAQSLYLVATGPAGRDSMHLKNSTCCSFLSVTPYCATSPQPASKIDASSSRFFIATSERYIPKRVAVRIERGRSRCLSRRRLMLSGGGFFNIKHANHNHVRPILKWNASRIE